MISGALDADALRHAFDAAFARPARSTTDSLASVLTLRVGGQPYILRATDIDGLHARPHVVTLPCDVPAMRGLVGLRGSVVPVFDLGVLLGFAPAAACPWLLMAGGSRPVGLGIERFEAHLRIEPGLLEAAASPDPGEFLGTGLCIGETLYRLIHVSRLIDAIRKRSHD